jgi:micrococcal nuclease
VRRALAVAALTVAVTACGTADETGEPGAGDARGTRAVVTRVVDGDTAEMLLGGREVDVRFIGIDAPESVAPDQPVECFGRRASAYTGSRLEGRTVRLEFDVERLDRFGRTLAYVWIGPELFNETLVAEGYAVVTTFPPNVRYVDRFVVAQRAAREAGLGLWSTCPERRRSIDSDRTGELGPPG